MTVIVNQRNTAETIKPFDYDPILKSLLDVQGYTAASVLADTDIYDWLSGLAVKRALGIDGDSTIREIGIALKVLISALYFDDLAIDENVFLIDELYGIGLAGARFLVWNSCLKSKTPYDLCNIMLPPPSNFELFFE